MQYVVQRCGEDELPEGVHIVIVEQGEGPHTMFVNGPVAESFALVRAWEASREPATEPTVLHAVAPQPVAREPIPRHRLLFAV